MKKFLFYILIIFFITGCAAFSNKENIYDEAENTGTRGGWAGSGGGGVEDWNDLKNKGMPADFADDSDASGTGGVDEVYGPGWNGDTDAPEKDDVYDKIESMTGGDIESVGDCLTGACLDGTSDGGTYNRYYDGDSHYMQIETADISANKTLTIPDAFTTTTLGYLDPTSSVQTQLDAKLAIANNLSDVNNAVTSFNNIKQAATTSATGVTELATDLEAQTGSDETRYVNSKQIITPWIDINREGFVDNTEATISFNDSTYVFTLTDAGSGWNYYRAGIKYTISGNKTTTLAGSPPTADTYYIYINSTDGTLTNSTSIWDLSSNHLPVATICWNNGNTPKYLMSEERHTILIDKREHEIIHSAIGTSVRTLGAISGYTIDTSTDAALTFGIAQTEIMDEDLFHTLTALSDPDGATATYANCYRTGASTWTWGILEDVPFVFTAAGYIQYDNAGTMTQGTTGKYFNWYLLYTNVTGDWRYTMIPGRAQFDSESDAFAENPNEFDWTGYPISESVVAYQWTYRTNASYGTKGKVQLVREPKLILESFSVVSTAPSNGGNVRDDTSESITGIWGNQDDILRNFGDDDDFGIRYDETTDDRLEIISNTGGVTNINIENEGAGTTALAIDGPITVTAEAYGAGWNGDNTVPTKNDTYDEIETKQDILTDSSGLAGALSDETGTGLSVFSTSPSLITPSLGVATATSIAVDTEVYGAGWNADLTAATKDAIYDKIETMGGTGNVNDNTAEAITGVWEIQNDTNFDYGNNADWNTAYNTTMESLLFSTTAINGSNDDTAMYRIRVNDGAGTLDADQEVFEILNNATELFSVDEDGDVYYAGSLVGASSNDPYSNYDETDGTDWWTGIDDTGNSFEWRTNVTVGNSVQMELTETGNLTLTGDLTITGSDLDIGVAGVKLTGDGDGALKLLGQGNGNDEDITLNFDDTANEVTVTTSTGVDNLNLSAIRVETTGDVTGGSLTTSKAVGYTIGTDDVREMYGGTIYVTSAATMTAAAVADGMWFKVVTIGDIAVSVDVNALDKMYLDGVLLDDGDKATNTSTTGDTIICEYYSADGWYCMSGSPDGDHWTDTGA